MNIGSFLNRKLWENDMVSNRAILIDNIDKIHTTEMGVDRIRRKTFRREKGGESKNKDCKI